ncbi:MULTISPECIES: glycosyltransferase [Polaromonas]|uniref:Glycosyltransferase n=1 Tax=Polaromonas aquatica TaxID=332657 RepID=A0ABW1U206_9BURK
MLQLVLDVVPTPVRWAQLDDRAKLSLAIPQGALIRYVKKTVQARFVAEWRLRGAASAGDVVLCFNGLPPLFKTSSTVAVFVQNRLLLDGSSLGRFPLKTRCRLILERLWFRAYQSHASYFVVQTPSMAELLKGALGRDITVRVRPFAGQLERPVVTGRAREGYDFVYVAVGEAHKNHENLLLAWRLLGEAGIKPSLALTVDPDAYPELAAKISRYRDDFGLSIDNLGYLSSANVAGVYAASKALVYPSLSESFGLPLIEAGACQLPVIAPERDYVRDVVEPVETFDPESPVSISRAIRRFLGNAEPVAEVLSANDFISGLLK